MKHTNSPFDVTGTSPSTRVVPVHRIVDMLHVTHAPHRIEEYRRAMLAGKKFPPISVIRLGRRFVIADGHKRFSACTQLGIANLPVEVWPVRRLVADQLAQAHCHCRLWWRALSGLHRGPAFRAQAWTQARYTLHHWRRVARSIWSLIVSPHRALRTPSYRP